VDGEGLAFCVGGECSLIVGALAGLKGNIKGKPGILWIDAHGDFNTPETTRSGYIGGMGLAFACGRGPKMNDAIEASRPLMSEENVVHVASRALDPKEYEAMSSSPMQLYTASAIRTDGLLRVADQAARYLDSRCDWITCHLDVDAIDPETLPAVNFPEGAGLSLEEVKKVVKRVHRTGKLKVFNLAGYNASLDQSKISAQKLLRLVSEIFSEDKTTV
jgi:arginase